MLNETNPSDLTLNPKILIFTLRGVYGHTHGEYPWMKIEDFAVKPSARLVGKLDLPEQPVNHDFQFIFL